MDCKNLRIDFIRSSGRKNLVKTSGQDTYVDNGANAYLNRGQMLLDSLIDMPHHERTLIKAISPGDWKLSFEMCRMVKEVWIADSEGRKKLDFVSLSDLREVYGYEAGSFSGIDQGVPRYYALASGAIAYEQKTLDADDLADESDWEDVRLGDTSSTNSGIVWMPPADKAYTIRVVGKWWTEQLTTDASVSWWAVNKPNLVVLAALAELEKDQRNTEGVNDWLAAMKP